MLSMGEAKEGTDGYYGRLPEPDSHSFSSYVNNATQDYKLC